MIELADVFCMSFPMKRARVRVTCEWVERLDPFTKFVFQMITSGKLEEEIRMVTLLQHHLISEELNRLVEWGLIQEDFTLTNLGIEYNLLMQIMNDVNNDSLRFYINFFNGRVISGDVPLESEPKGMKMKSNVAWIRTQSANFKNSKECFVAKHLFLHPEAYKLSKEMIEAIDVWLEVDKRDESYFYVKSVDKLNDWAFHSHKQKDDDLILNIMIPSIKITFSHPELRKYQHVLDDLRRLAAYDPALISWASHQLLDLEREYNKRWKVQEKSYYWCEEQQGYSDVFQENQPVRNNCYKLNVPCIAPAKDWIADTYSHLPNGFEVSFEYENEVPYIYYAQSIHLLEELE
jgi:hypothetical protein